MPGVDRIEVYYAKNETELDKIPTPLERGWNLFAGGNVCILEVPEDERKEIIGKIRNLEFGLQD